MTKHFSIGLLIGFLGCAAAAHAESCSRSAQYLVENGSNDLTQDEARPAQIYKSLSAICDETLLMPNVKDAFILKTGAIAVIPKREGIGVTAATLAEFCERFPKQTLRFVSRKELTTTANIGRAVRLDSSTATPCQKITQGG